MPTSRKRRKKAAGAQTRRTEENRIKKGSENTPAPPPNFVFYTKSDRARASIPANSINVLSQHHPGQSAECPCSQSSHSLPCIGLRTDAPTRYPSCRPRMRPFKALGRALSDKHTNSLLHSNALFEVKNSKCFNVVGTWEKYIAFQMNKLPSGSYE